MSTDECRSLRGDLAAVALDRAEPSERTRLLAHVDHCDDCRVDLIDLQRVAAALPAASLDNLDAIPYPSHDLLDRISRETRAERKRERRTRLGRVAAAATGIAAAAVVAIVLTFNGGDNAPPLQPFAVAPVGASATFGLDGNDQGTRIVLRHSGLDPERIYWLWLTDAAGGRFTGGSFRGTQQDETITLQSALPVDKTVRVWCTGEKLDDVVLDKWIKR